MTNAPIILVPGFWLGAWAWDEVAAALRADGHDVTALTLPGLESADVDRSAISLSDHVDAICEAVKAAGRPVVLAVHSGTGFSGYVASDRVPEQIAAMVYVDSAPGKPPLDPGFDAVEKPLNWEELSAEENLDGLTEEQLETFRRRAVPEPGGVLREAIALTNDARLDLPTTMICTGFTSDEYKDAVKDGYAWLAGVPELRTSPGSTCRRATGRCGRAHRSSPRSSATSRRRTLSTRSGTPSTAPPRPACGRIERQPTMRCPPPLLEGRSRCAVLDGCHGSCASE